jgi:hypothetical protein
MRPSAVLWSIPLLEYREVSHFKWFSRLSILSGKTWTSGFLRISSSTATIAPRGSVAISDERTFLSRRVGARPRHPFFYATFEPCDQSVALGKEFSVRDSLPILSEASTIVFALVSDSDLVLFSFGTR